MCAALQSGRHTHTYTHMNTQAHAECCARARCVCCRRYRIVTHRLKHAFRDVRPPQPEACSICMDTMVVGERAQHGITRVRVWHGGGLMGMHERGMAVHMCECGMVVGCARARHGGACVRVWHGGG